MGRYVVAGASSGIGEALCRLLVANGHQVIGISRRHAPAATTSIQANVTTDVLPDDSQALDGLVYCPGSITLKPFRSLKQQDVLADLEVNVLGACRVLQHYQSNLQQSVKASVVLLGSVAAGTGMPYHASVAISKGAIEALTRSLAAEWSPKVRVNCLALSLTDTPMAERLLNTEEKRLAAANRHPLKRIGDAKEVAATAHWLLSDSSGFMTGQVIHMDGGISSLKM